MNPQQIKRCLFTIILLLTLPLCVIPQEDTTSCSLLFTGDIMGHDTQIQSAYNDSTGEYHYDTCFFAIRSILRSTNITVGNLEVTLAGKPYKGYPQFSTPDGMALALKKAGVDVLVQANNHALDRGKTGLERTLGVLDLLEMPHAGTYRNKEERDSTYPLLIEKNDIRICLLNYTYGTNGIPVPEPTVVNLIDRGIIKKDLEKARMMNPDKIIVCMHWGTEYEPLPDAQQRSLAEFLFGEGADIIIGSHPHVIQPMERYPARDELKERVVVWSTGNFISNQKTPGTDGGALIYLRLEKTDSICTIAEAGYLLCWVYRPVVNYRQQFFVLPAAEYEHDPLFFPEKSHYQRMREFILESRTHLQRHNTGFSEIIPGVKAE